MHCNLLLVRGLDLWAGIAFDPLLQPMIAYTARNLSNVMDGAQVIDLPIIIQSEETITKSYSFSLPDGETLIALWADGVAVDHDPGVPATLIIPGRAGQTPTGIDILFGVEQELISNNENDDLVIRDFSLKDYPVFIRLSKP